MQTEIATPELTETTKHEWAFRLAEPSDAPAFAEWVSAGLSEGLFDREDVSAGLKSNSPTSVAFCVEKDGKVVAFAPLTAVMLIPHLCFSPDAAGRDKLRAMKMLMAGVSAFAVQYGIRKILTLSKEEYPVAQWAPKK
jgi:hypothetical protein